MKSVCSLLKLPLLLKNCRLREGESFRRNGSQILAATRLASNLKEAILKQLYLTSFRKRKTYLDILTPRQAILYQDWLLSNRERAETMLKERKKSSIEKEPGAVLKSPISSGTGKDYLNLEKLSLCLEESLEPTNLILL